jgi:hypothetical protein
MNCITFRTHTPLILKINGTKPILLGIVLAMASMITHRSFAAGLAPVNLGSAAHFTILAGAAITTTGGGTINGDVGAYPIAGSGIGLPAAQVHGTIYETDATGPAGAVIAPALLLAAKDDLTTAMNDAAGRTPVPADPDHLNPNGGNIGGLNLTPGIYKFTGTASITGADVFLTGGPDDVWIFQIAADLQVGSMRNIILAGGAQARNVFWQVGTSANIGTFAVFKGTIMSNQGIVMMTSSTLEGRALAFTAGITYNGNSGNLPTPEAPIFTGIVRTTTNATVVLSTSPYFFVTLQTSPDLSPTNWTMIATNTPATNIWTFTDTNAMTTVPQRFYRAFITTP